MGNALLKENKGKKGSYTIRVKNFQLLFRL
jgi:hypothetical protein